MKITKPIVRSEGFPLYISYFVGYRNKKPKLMTYLGMYSINYEFKERLDVKKITQILDLESFIELMDYIIENFLKEEFKKDEMP